jgi:peptidoglycan/LPS O-acetylase OafA/YrhL
MEPKLRSVVSDSQNYMPQLDALRFIAVLGVLISHFWIPHGLPWLLADMDWGWLGVRLFFVLSGFLITGILLDSRKIAEMSVHTPAFLIRQFYIRRFLRIFPIYYLAIAVTLALNLSPGRELWGWLLSYTSNIYIAVHNSWIGPFSHFWSLAVEEQFYLLWPCVIMFLPKKWIPFVILFAILLAPAYRFWAYQIYRFEISPFDFKAATFTLANLDSLGLGALLAFAWRTKLALRTIQKYLTKLILPFGIVLYLTSLALYHYHLKPSVFFTLNDFAASLIFTWLVSTAAIGLGGIVGRLMTVPLLMYLGKISYGIYVFHYFVPLMVFPVFEALKIPLQVPGVSNFIVSGMLTIALAALSWRVLERPINKLKRHFEYSPISNTQRLVDTPSVRSIN